MLISTLATLVMLVPQSDALKQAQGDLASTDPAVRYEAVHELAAMGKKARRATAALAERLEDDVERVANAAEYALTEIGPGAIKELTPSLEDDRRAGRAARVLLQLGSRGEKAVASFVEEQPPSIALVAVCAQTGDLERIFACMATPELRRSCLRAMRVFADGQAVPASASLDAEWTAAAEWALRIGTPPMEPLLEALANADPAIREAAAFRLGTISSELDEAATGAVLKLLDDEDPGVTEIAVWAIAQGGETTLHHLDEQMHAGMCARFLAGEVSMRSAIALLPERAVEVFLQGLDTSNPTVRLESVRGLAGLEFYAADAVDALLRIGEDGRSAIGQEASYAANVIKESLLGMGGLRHALRSGDPEKQNEALEAIRRAGADTKKEALPDLIALMGEGDDSIALPATQTILAMGAPGLHALVEALENAKTAKAAADALGWSLAGDILLVHHLKNVEVNAVSITILPLLLESALPSLVEALQHEDLRAQALIGIRKIAARVPAQKASESIERLEAGPVRECLKWALQVESSALAKDALAILRGSDATLHETAVYALGHALAGDATFDADTLGTLTDGLDHPELAMKIACAWAIGMAGGHSDESLEPVPGYGANILRPRDEVLKSAMNFTGGRRGLYHAMGMRPGLKLPVNWRIAASWIEEPPWHGPVPDVTDFPEGGVRCAERLVDMLSSEERELVLIAMFALRGIAPLAASRLEELRAMLADDEMMYVGAGVMERMGAPAAAALPDLLATMERMKRPMPIVFAVSNIGTPESEAKLLEMLSPQHQAAPFAILALAPRETLTPKQTQAVIRAFHDGHVIAASLLTRCGDAGLEALVKGLEPRNPTHQATAAYAIGLMQDVPLDVLSQLDKLTRTGEKPVQAAAREALERLRR
jgi:hypothetical protein